MRGRHSMVGAGSAAVCTNGLSARGALCWDCGPHKAESVLRPFRGACGTVDAATAAEISCRLGVHSRIDALGRLDGSGCSGQWFSFQWRLR